MDYSPQQQQIYPLQFIQLAIRLGYAQKDLYPITQEQIQFQFNLITKKMQPKEKQFYIHKKLIIYQSRRQKIIKQVQSHYQLIKNKIDTYNKYNPKIKQILQQHQKSIKKNKKYNQVLSKASQRSQSNKKYFISNTINVGRASPILSNRSSLSKTSQTSRNIDSQVSNRSNRTSSSANSLTRSKLNEVRQKQKQMQQLKKRIFQQKQRQNQLRFLKAQENSLNKSRKAKIRSQISQKIVKQNKNQIDTIRNLGMKDHLQNLKFNIVKNNQKREKYYNSISYSHNKNLDLYFVNQVNKQIKNSQKLRNKYRYEEKAKSSSQWQNNFTELKRQTLQFVHEQREIKNRLTAQRKSFQQREEKKFRQQILLFQNKRTSDAQRRRYQEMQKRKLQGTLHKIKRQIVSKNKKGLQRIDEIRKKLINNNYNEKLEQINYIESMKKKLNSVKLNANKGLIQRK